LQAALLIGLMTAVSSGLPSHHHDGAEVGPALADAGHHGHGTQILEQSDRQTSEIFGVALPPPPTARLEEAAVPVVVPFATTSRLLATGRSPPSSRPRAPPVSA
jgi:hypothetical protein